MRKMVLALSFLLLGAVAGQAQSSSSGISSSSEGSVAADSGSGVFNGTPSSNKPDSRKREQSVGSVTESFVYMEAPAQSGADRSLMGWSVVPTLTPAHGFGMQADFESLYMRAVYPGQSWLFMTAGPRYVMAPRARFTPFIYAEAGEVRLETQGKRSVDWEPVAKGGFGLQTRLSDHFGVTLVPGEWTGLRYDYNGSWNDSFTARFGITFYLAKNKGPVS